MYEGVVSIVWSMDCRGQERTRSMESMEACCHFCRSRRREEMRAVPVVTIPLSRTSINQPLLSSTTHIPSKVNLFLIENVMMLLVLVVFRLLWMLCWIFILMNLVLYIMMCSILWCAFHFGCKYYKSFWETIITAITHHATALLNREFDAQVFVYGWNCDV